MAKGKLPFPPKKPGAVDGPGAGPAIAASRGAVAADQGKKLPPWLMKGKAGKGQDAPAKGKKKGY